MITFNYDPEYARGFKKRHSNWETAVSIQHELFPSVSVTAAYHRRWYGNIPITDNILDSPADYDPYCVAAPVGPAAARHRQGEADL